MRAPLRSIRWSSPGPCWASKPAPLGRSRPSDAFRCRMLSRFLAMGRTLLPGCRPCCSTFPAATLILFPSLFLMRTPGGSFSGRPHGFPAPVGHEDAKKSRRAFLPDGFFNGPRPTLSPPPASVRLSAAFHQSRRPGTRTPACAPGRGSDRSHPRSRQDRCRPPAKSPHPSKS